MEQPMSRGVKEPALPTEFESSAHQLARSIDKLFEIIAQSKARGSTYENSVTRPHSEETLLVRILLLETEASIPGETVLKFLLPSTSLFSDPPTTSHSGLLILKKHADLGPTGGKGIPESVIVPGVSRARVSPPGSLQGMDRLGKVRGYRIPRGGASRSSLGGLGTQYCWPSSRSSVSRW